MFIYNLLALTLIVGVSVSSSAPSIAVRSKSPSNAAKPWQDFISYSIEASSLADYGGNLLTPNTFSYNLLESIKEHMGVYPVVRVGGNTDQISYDPNANFTPKGIEDSNISADYPINIIVGPTYYEAYQTVGDTQCPICSIYSVCIIHLCPDFALRPTLLSSTTTIASAPVLCKFLDGKVESRGLGNEPDLFWRSWQRPNNYTEAGYVSEWRSLRSDLLAPMPCKAPFMAPSFAGLDRDDAFFKLSAVTTFQGRTRCR
ncbi:hypothetical protein VTL71DRAFT_9921 [Oculimacula yallundae]|uniref:Uncharacterized protein n=1 Tax=Oculimacula yallundae TaxID=86028 RepID=A0ABR4BQX2_9HELO